MATVKQLVQDLADGRATLEDVVRDFKRRAWPADPPLTDAQLWGAEDPPPAPANSAAWITLNPGLTYAQRRDLFAAYRARH